MTIRKIDLSALTHYKIISLCLMCEQQKWEFEWPKNYRDILEIKLPENEMYILDYLLYGFV